METANPAKVAVKKKSFWKRRRAWFIAGGVLLVVLMIGAVAGGGGGDQTFVTTTVEQGTLVQTVEASGELSSIDDVDLSFESSGSVGVISAAIGQEVKSGDVIAALDAKDVLADLVRAQESVNFAQANLTQARAGSTDEQIAAAQALLDAAQTDYDNAVATGAEAVTAAELALEDAQDDLAQTKTDAVEDVEQTYEDLLSVMRSAVIEIRSTLADADEILGRENKNINDLFENILGATNPQTMNDAKIAYDDAADARDDVEETVYALTTSSTQETLDAAADDVEEALEYTALALWHTRRVLDATHSNSVNLSTDDVTAYKTTIDTARNTIQSEEETLLAQRQLIDATVIAADSAVEDAENAAVAAVSALRKATVDTAASTASAKATVAARTADLNNVSAEARSVDLAPYQAQLGQALAELDAASARLAKTEIRAPIDGVVTAIDVDSGESVVAGTSVVTVQTTGLDAFRVTVDISESDIAKLSLDQQAEMTFDAFGDDVTVRGHVASIDPAEETIEGVVFYEVDVYLDESIAGMRPGMSADVTITTKEIPDTLFVPQRAVLQRDGEKYVRIPSGNNFEERVVTTGLRGDNGRLELLSGVEAGETIITSIRD